MATKTGLLTKKALKDSALSLAAVNEEELFTTVIAALKRSPQFCMPLLQRDTFLEAILTDEDAKETLKKLVCCFAKEYSSLMQAMSRVPAAARYTTFQIQWLQRIRTIVEKGERALGDAQDADEDEEEHVTAMAGYVAVLVLSGFETQQVEQRAILAVFQTIAREVFKYQQAKATTKQEVDIAQENEGEEEEALSEETDNALYRVCGAQLHRMIELRKKKLRDAYPGGSRETAAELEAEVEFLKQLRMTSEEKAEYLPPSLMSTERGGRTFPKPCMIPFIRRVVQQVKAEINDEAFKRYGENLFKVKLVVSDFIQSSYSDDYYPVGHRNYAAM